MISAQERYAKMSAYCTEFVKATRPELDGTAARKTAREAARSVLTNATETKIFVTANARALRHFLGMRGDPAADAEIRATACEMLALLKAEAGDIFGDIDDGGVFLTVKHPKV
jgi:thymidylate synthase (FAD)